MIKSGDIWLIDFDPIVGHEQASRRPGLVISGNAMNDHFGISIVCHLTTAIKNMAGAVILKPDKLNKLEKPSEVLGMHVKSVSHLRFNRKIGTIDEITRQKIIANIDNIFKY